MKKMMRDGSDKKKKMRKFELGEKEKNIENQGREKENEKDGKKC